MLLHLFPWSGDVFREASYVGKQWITVFGRDRADLGPSHAAGLAAAEAARYAPPRPLDRALADLHQAWTDEKRFLDRLALARPRRDLLRSIAALEADRADRLTALEATCRQAATKVARAQQRVDAAAAVAAARLRDRLLTAWDAQLDAAREAAQVVIDGPGCSGSGGRATSGGRSARRPGSTRARSMT